MATNILIRLTTEDPAWSKECYESLRWNTNLLFTDENSACIVVDENIFFTLMYRDLFATFTDKQISDSRTHAISGVSSACAPCAEVDEIAERRFKAGGTKPRPAQGEEFMCARDLDDPDGSGVGFLYMDPQVDSEEFGSF